MSRRLGFHLATLGAALVAVTASLLAQGGAELETLQLRPNFYLIAGAGANIAVQIGDDGTVVVDAGSAAAAPAVVAAIKKVTAAPIRYVIDTGPDADHVGGNETIAKAGQTLLSTRATGLPNDFSSGAASIMAAEKVLTRMSAPSGQTSPFPFASWPTETFDYGRRYMYLNGEGIEVLQQPSAHSDGDAIVFFRRSDVVVAGDVIDADHFPVIDVAPRRLARRRVGRAEPDRLPGHSVGAHRVPGSGHDCRPGPRPPVRPVRRRALSRHDHDHPRPRGRPDEGG